MIDPGYVPTGRDEGREAEVPASGANPGWLDSISESFAAAAKASGVVSDRFSIAGAPVCLRFASGPMRRNLARVFDHLGELAGSGSIAPALTVHVWDSASTGTEPPWRPSVPESSPPGALFHIDRPPLRIGYQPRLETLTAFDSRTGIAWYWVGNALEQPSWDQGSPMRHLLFWWLVSRGLLPVHGAAVGKPSGGVLLIGKSGSGKSTTALANLGSELMYAGDDYVAVALEPTPWIHSLYCTGKLEPAGIRGLLPHLLPLVSNPGELHSEKGVIYLQEHFSEQTTAGFPLRAILVPRVSGARQEHRIVETPRGAAFAALAPNTMLELRTAGAEEFGSMSRLVKSVPCYSLELGSDVASIPRTISEFLDRLPTA